MQFYGSLTPPTIKAVFWKSVSITAPLLALALTVTWCHSIPEKSFRTDNCIQGSLQHECLECNRKALTAYYRAILRYYTPLPSPHLVCDTVPPEVPKCVYLLLGSQSLSCFLRNGLRQNFLLRITGISQASIRFILYFKIICAFPQLSPPPLTSVFFSFTTAKKNHGIICHEEPEKPVP